MQDRRYYFHRSGRIIAHPATTERDVENLIKLATRIADTSDVLRTAAVLRTLLVTFAESARENALRSVAECDRIDELVAEVETYYSDCLFDDYTLPNISVAERASQGGYPR